MLSLASLLPVCIDRAVTVPQASDTMPEKRSDRLSVSCCRTLSGKLLAVPCLTRLLDIIDTLTHADADAFNSPSLPSSGLGLVPHYQSKHKGFSSTQSTKAYNRWHISLPTLCLPLCSPSVFAWPADRPGLSKTRAQA
ncbi:hypothetical protein LX32DRAFT_644366 [Colletotrichum zoysiae]|uniref:Uncharacterized protein n=1 Tax=Colletotrichum zoysiae TaxID=1216348 RepID=A0AAD9H719_9PEZI|nr:hypothetical protein LX32DRAFT_644366 [Colletotrichum zoysiae]